jgi:rhodanese-related sulfurtransferase
MDEFISPDDLHHRMQGDDPPVVIDVRGPEEYADGHVAGAVSIPADQLSSRLDEIPRDQLVVTY